MDDTAKLHFKLVVECPNENTPSDVTRGIVSVDGKKIQDIELIGKTDAHEIEFELGMDDGDHTLTVEHTYSESPQSALVISKIEIDEIDLGVLTYQGVYTPTYPEPWYSDEVTAGRPPKQNIGAGADGSACLFMGWEGRYDLKFSTPLYEWLLENI